MWFSPQINSNNLRFDCLPMQPLATSSSGEEEYDEEYYDEDSEDDEDYNYNDEEEEQETTTAKPKEDESAKATNSSAAAAPLLRSWYGTDFYFHLTLNIAQTMLTSRYTFPPANVTSFPNFFIPKQKGASFARTAIGGVGHWSATPGGGPRWTRRPSPRWTTRASLAGEETLPPRQRRGGAGGASTRPAHSRGHWKAISWPSTGTDR